METINSCLYSRTVEQGKNSSARKAPFKANGCYPAAPASIISI